MVVIAASAGLAGCGAANRAAGSVPPAQPAVLAAAPPSGATVTTGGTVTAGGTGTVSGTPDTMTVGIGVSTTAPHAADALDRNNSIAAAVDAALQRDGVPAADIATTGLSLQQNWSGSGPGGYTAYDHVTATIRDPAASGHVIDDALAPAGDSGRLDQVELSISDTDPLMTAARAQAVRSARSQAAQMAAALGGRLGPLVSLTDLPATGVAYQPVPYGSASAGGAGATVPIQTGTQQLTVQVTGVWRVSSGD